MTTRDEPSDFTPRQMYWAILLSCSVALFIGAFMAFVTETDTDAPVVRQLQVNQ